MASTSLAGATTTAQNYTTAHQEHCALTGSTYTYTTENHGHSKQATSSPAPDQPDRPQRRTMIKNDPLYTQRAQENYTQKQMQVTQLQEEDCDPDSSPYTILPTSSHRMCLRFFHDGNGHPGPPTHKIKHPNAVPLGRNGARRRGDHSRQGRPCYSRQPHEARPEEKAASASHEPFSPTTQQGGHQSGKPTRNTQPPMPTTSH